MKTNQLKEMTVDQLTKELASLQREQFNLRMQKGMTEGAKLHLYKRVRREIARVKTFINQKEQQV